MEEAQPLLPRNDDEIIKQPTNDAAENLPPSNYYSSLNNLMPESQQLYHSDIEVHHHVHHLEKTNWKACFWEFLMLFLRIKGVNRRFS